ncbi:hypothetical protein [Streptomyces violascens]|uniref:hypothetical protein n=1 Tax=Streptomyces violascens TaxID=67381 RepID=UPI0016781A8D|nr:hypothetical protein [Streptomyces violascens]
MRPPSRPQYGGEVPHQTTITERGSFAIARCSCGWTGPARRSRDRARTDAESHTPQTCTPSAD